MLDNIHCYKDEKKHKIILGLWYDYYKELMTRSARENIDYEKHFHSIESIETLGRTRWGLPKFFKMVWPHDPAISLLGEVKGNEAAAIQETLQASVTAAVFTVTNIRNKSSCRGTAPNKYTPQGLHSSRSIENPVAVNLKALC